MISESTENTASPNIVRETASLPQSIEELKKSPREKRREQYIDLVNLANEQQAKYIQIQEAISELLTTQPDSTYSHIIQYLEEEDINLHATDRMLIKNFLTAFNKRKATTQKIIRTFRTIAQKKSPELNASIIDMESGKYFYQAITGILPEGEVFLEDHVYAIGLIVNSVDDYRKLHNVENSIGFYTTDQKLKGFYNQWKIGQFAGFPFFAAMEFSKNTTAHEKGHAENSTIKHALRQIGYKYISETWGGPEEISFKIFAQYVTDAHKRIIKLSRLNLSTQTIEEGVLQIAKQLLKEIGPFFSHALGWAKDEVISDFISDDNFLHLGNLYHFSLSRDGSPNYQYLNAIGISRDLFQGTIELEKTYSHIVNTYNDILEINVKFIEKLFEDSKLCPHITPTKSELIAFMRQNPINTWKKRGQRYFRAKESVENVLLFAKKISNLLKKLQVLKSDYENDIHIKVYTNDQNTEKNIIQVLEKQISSLETKLSEYLEIFHDVETPELLTDDSKKEFMVDLDIMQRRFDEIDSNKKALTSEAFAFSDELVSNPLYQFVHETERNPWKKPLANLEELHSQLIEKILRKTEFILQNKWSPLYRDPDIEPILDDLVTFFSTYRDQQFDTNMIALFLRSRIRSANTVQEILSNITLYIDQILTLQQRKSVMKFRRDDFLSTVQSVLQTSSKMLDGAGFYTSSNRNDAALFTSIYEKLSTEDQKFLTEFQKTKQEVLEKETNLLRGIAAQAGIRIDFH